MSETGWTGGVSRRLVLGGMTTAGLTVSGAIASPALAQRGFTPRRWYEGDYRIVQTNLREIDALQKPRDIARAIKEFGGNVIVSNIGGITAFYPTALKYHYRSPYLRGDFVGEMIEAAHIEGMAYLGRFDTSKGRKPVFDAHPEWFSLRRDGKPREYNGTYQACPTGEWAQEYAIEILREALTRYKPDGVFFNGVYFPSYNWYNRAAEGNCTCDNCRRAFRAMYNRDLPAIDGPADPAWADYEMFQRRVLGALLKKIDVATAPLLQGAPIMNRAVVGRGELQRGVDRPPPEWPYQGGEQTRSYLAANPGKPYSATSAVFMDFPWRLVTETAAYHQLRMAQVMGAGGHLDLYLMGTFADVVERGWIPPVSRLFKWRAANEAAYAGMAPTARVGLYSSAATRHLAGIGEIFRTEGKPFAEETTGITRGAYMMLVDSRVPFQFVSDARVADGTTKLVDDFDVLYLPNTAVLTPAEAKALDAFVAAGGLLIATGMVGGYRADETRAPAVALACLPTASYGDPQDAIGWSLDPAKGSLKVTGRVPIDNHYYAGPLRAGTKTLLPFAAEADWGPPELNFVKPGAPVRKLPGVAMRAHGKGRAIHIPWHIDWMYHRDGLPVHQELIAQLIATYAAPQTFTLAGSGAVELMQLGRADGRSLLHVVNYAGQRNGRYDAAPKLHGLRLGVRGPSGEARALVGGVALQGRREGDTTWYDLPPLDAFEAILV